MGWREDVKLGIARISDLYLGTDNGQMGVQVTATAAEINKACDESAKAVVSITAATLSLTQALHAGKICTFDKIDGIDVTLPEATGTGDIYTLVLGTALTSDTITILTADATNADYAGIVTCIDLDAATTMLQFQSLQASGNNVITMNMTTQGGVNLGLDWYQVTDIKTDLWQVVGNFVCTAGADPATPFS